MVNNEIYKFSRCNAARSLLRLFARVAPLAFARKLPLGSSPHNVFTVCTSPRRLWGESFKVVASIAQGQRLDLPELADSMRRVNVRITQGQRLSSPGQWPAVSRPTSGLFEVNQGENRKMRRRNILAQRRDTSIDRFRE